MKTRRSLRHSLAEELRTRILAGEWRPGDRLPSEPELARRRTVSRSSMRAAITVLEEDGFVSRKHGSGTYVTHRPALPNDLGRNFGVSSLIASTGMQPGTVEESSGAVPAPAAVAEALGVEEGAPVSCAAPRPHGRRAARRRRRPTGAGSSTSRPRSCPRSPRARSTRRSRSAAWPSTTASRELTPRNADGEVARRLDVPRGTLLLTIDQVDRTADGVAVLVSREHHLADAFTFTLLRRGPGEET